MVLSRGKRPTAHPSGAPGRGQSNTGGPGWNIEGEEGLKVVRDHDRGVNKNHVDAEQGQKKATRSGQLQMAIPDEASTGTFSADVGTAIRSGLSHSR